MCILFTYRKLSSIHSESVTTSRSKTCTYSYAEKNQIYLRVGKAVYTKGSSLRLIAPLNTTALTLPVLRIETRVEVCCLTYTVKPVLKTTSIKQFTAL